MTEGMEYAYNVEVTALQRSGHGRPGVYRITFDVGTDGAAIGGCVEMFRPDTDDLDALIEGTGVEWDDATWERVRQETTWRPPRGEVNVTGMELHQMVDAASDELVRHNDPPNVFRHGDELVRIDSTDNHEPVLRPFIVQTLQTWLTRKAMWHRVKVTDKDGVETRTDIVATPTQTAVKTVMAEPPTDIPVVLGTVMAPVMRPDGTVLDRGGYDPATRLFYARPRGMSPVVYDNPAEAMRVIDEMVRDFPFDPNGTADFANYLGYLLTPAARSIIGVACVPLAYFEAAVPRTGKDKLAGTASLIYYGTTAASKADPGDRAEWKKSITAILRGGEQLVVFTNLTGTLESDALAGVLTSPRWSDRILGESRAEAFNVNTTMAVTANNLTLGRDFPNRIYRIRLDANRPDPENRHFSKDDLESWVHANRNKLLGAVLSLCRLWHEADRPMADITWSSYTPWARTVGGILENAGVKGFLDNRTDVAADNVDPDTATFNEFMRQVHAKFGAEVAPLIADIMRSGIAEWPDDILDRNGALKPNAAQLLGTYLKRHAREVTPDMLRIDVEHDTVANANRYRVTLVGQSA